MGCDIHLYLENVEAVTINGKDTGETHVNSIARFRPGRSYAMFSLMAGARRDEEFILFEPKGLPEKLGYEAESDNWLFIYAEADDYEGYCTREQAEKWVKSGSSTWRDDKQKYVSHPDWHTHSWLNLQEFEQVKAAYESKIFPKQSWYQMTPYLKDTTLYDGTQIDLTQLKVTYQEKGRYRGNYLFEVGPYEPAVFPPVYEAVLGALRALGDTGRIVFWFDN